MNQIVILTGPSGVGKTVLAEYLIEALGLSRCVTATSRLPRPGEKDGIDYFFLSSEEFEQIRSAHP